MENRYGQELREANRRILELSPAVPTLRTVMAFEFKKCWSPAKFALEIGCGEGDSAEPILYYTNAHLDLLDESSEMIESAERRLRVHTGRTRFITADGLDYLRRAHPYNIIMSSWTIHNFTWPEKNKLFRAIYENLLPGGTFLFMDKVYPEHDKKALLERQIWRYRYLPPKWRCDIIAHERDDFMDTYRMDEPELHKALALSGFQFEVIDRVERDVVIVAKKK